MTRQLLVPLDGSALADSAIPLAVEIARRLDLGIMLTRVHSPIGILPSPPEMPTFIPSPEIDNRIREISEEWLKTKAAEVRHLGGLRVSSEFRAGDPANEIVALAAEQDAHAIVCSTHGVGGLAPHWIGSVADFVVRHASCPVLTLPPKAVVRSGAVAKVLVLLDGSEVSDAILPHAEWLAQAFNAEIELLSVVAPTWLADNLSPKDEDRFGVDAYAATVKERLDGIAAGLRKKGLRVRTVVEIGLSPTRTILDHIAHTNPDALALATYGRGFSRLFLGSVADKVLRSSGRPTLMLRPRVEAGIRPEVSSAHANAYEFAGGM
ncbi:MAG: universal stress protein [Gemmatimonadales bacterium]